MAERAVFAHRGWVPDGEARTVTEDPNQPGHFQVQAGDNAYAVVVGVKREIPSISCRALGGLPAKPGREYHVIEGPTPLAMAAGVMQ